MLKPNKSNRVSNKFIHRDHILEAEIYAKISSWTSVRFGILAKINSSVCEIFSPLFNSLKFVRGFHQDLAIFFAEC